MQQTNTKRQVGRVRLQQALGAQHRVAVALVERGHNYTLSTHH